nr:MAG TPA: hypothetical protein [Caudoviricetes sp.]
MFIFKFGCKGLSITIFRLGSKNRKGSRWQILTCIAGIVTVKI